MATSEQASIAAGIRSGRIDTEQAARLLEGGKAQVRLSGRFPAGTSVELRKRTGTRFSEGEQIVGRRKVGEDSTVTFSDDVEAGERYWICATVDDELRAVAVTGKVPAPEKERRERPDAAAARPFQREDPRWSVEAGSRGVPVVESGTVRQGDKVLEQSFVDGAKGPGDVERQPAPAQSDIPEGTQQRSDTPLGEGTPVDPSEFVPEVPQSEVPDGAKQRSDTPQGDAALVPPGEQQPGARQEDTDGIQQRSDTPHGEATPIPSTDPVEQVLIRDGSEARAYGGDVQATGSAKGKGKEPGTQKITGKAKPVEQTAPKAPRVSRRKGSTKASRSAASKKAAATRRRNAAKKS